MRRNPLRFYITSHPDREAHFGGGLNLFRDVSFGTENEFRPISGEMGGERVWFKHILTHEHHMDDTGYVVSIPIENEDGSYTYSVTPAFYERMVFAKENPLRGVNGFLLVYENLFENEAAQHLRDVRIDFSKSDWRNSYSIHAGKEEEADDDNRFEVAVDGYGYKQGDVIHTWEGMDYPSSADKRDFIEKDGRRLKVIHKDDVIAVERDGELTPSEGFAIIKPLDENEDYVDDDGLLIREKYKSDQMMGVVVNSNDSELNTKTVLYLKKKYFCIEQNDERFYCVETSDICILF
jgi:hypothetical protein